MLCIVSGGQTGVDRAALDVAIRLQIRHSGWCPKGKRAEDGVISDVYNLKETDSEDYDERTVKNILDSEATLILIPEYSAIDSISDGTKLTVNQLKRVSKPYLIIEVSNCEQNNDKSINECLKWLSIEKPKVLNIAGPRESTVADIYDKCVVFLNQLFSQLKESENFQSF